MIVDKYKDVVEDINRHKSLVSLFNTSTQKAVALCMWDYVRDHLDELYYMLTDEEIDSGDVDYGYDAVERIKQDFCEEFEKDTEIVIDWNNQCILCERYSTSVPPHPCMGCPLGTCAAYADNPYHTLVEYALHDTDKNSALSAIEAIIKAIKRER